MTHMNHRHLKRIPYKYSLLESHANMRCLGAGTNYIFAMPSACTARDPLSSECKVKLDQEILLPLFENSGVFLSPGRLWAHEVSLPSGPTCAVNTVSIFWFLLLHVRKPELDISVDPRKPANQLSYIRRWYYRSGNMYTQTSTSYVFVSAGSKVNFFCKQF
jgi:hypothetical protein